MTITIPVWLLWLIGIALVIPIAAFVAFLAAIGWEMRRMFRK